MNQKQAQLLADIVGGEAWLSGEHWVVSVNRPDGSVVVIATDSVVEFASDSDLDSGIETKRICLSDDREESGFWIVEDESGNVFYRNAIVEAGWRWREEAEEHALAVHSKTGANCEVRRLSAKLPKSEN